MHSGTAHINEGSHLPLLIYHMFLLTSMPPLLLVLLPCMFRLCHALYITNDDCDDETDNVKLNFIIQGSQHTQSTKFKHFSRTFKDPNCIFFKHENYRQKAIS